MTILIIGSGTPKQTKFETINFISSPKAKENKDNNEEFDMFVIFTTEYYIKPVRTDKKLTREVFADY